MKKLFLTYITFLVVLPAVYAQTGVYIEYKLSGSSDNKIGLSGNNKIYAQGEHSRHEMQINIPGMPTGPINTVTLTRKDKPNTIITINPSAKTYTEMSFEQYETKEQKSKEPFEITVVGKEQVNGYNCTHIIAKYKNSQKVRNEWWTSKEVPGFSGFSGVKGNKYLDDDNLFKEMAEKGADGFPVRMKISDGEMGSFVMDLVKAEKKNIDASLFEIPAGYTKAAALDLSNMPKSMNEVMKMSPEEQQKMLEDLMKMYGGQAPQGKP